MLVEHVFVTTLECDDALARSAGFLKGLGFRIKPSESGSLHAVRGKKHPRTRKLVRLPQVVRMTYDRGRVTVAAGLTPRRGRVRPVYARLMTALARGLELLLVQGAPPDQAAAECRQIETRFGSLWTLGEKIVVTLLIILLLALIGIIIAAAANI